METGARPSRGAWRPVLACALLVAAFAARAQTCAPPTGAPAQPYQALAAAARDDLSLLVDEYMFVHRWTRHAEATAAGFRYGDLVYGEVLKRGGRFDAGKTAQWRRAYSDAGKARARFLAGLGSTIDLARVDPAALDWVLHVCLAPRTWSQVKLRDDCRFVFSAGLLPDARQREVKGATTPGVRPVSFRVRGGRCAKWPARALSEKGDAVECVRSGGAEVVLELETDRGAGARQVLAPLPGPAVAPEPYQTSKLTEPATEVISLWRSRDYRQQQLGRGCPACALYSADVRPPVPDAVILRAETVSSSGVGWQRCPAGLRCGVNEFSPPDSPRLSGCAGVASCRVWRLAETDAEASDVIQLTYQAPETVCVNCPENVDFETAHRNWAAALRNARPRCEAVADLPVQSIAVPAGAR